MWQQLIIRTPPSQHFHPSDSSIPRHPQPRTMVSWMDTLILTSGCLPDAPPWNTAAIQVQHCSHCWPASTHPLTCPRLPPPRLTGADSGPSDSSKARSPMTDNGRSSGRWVGTLFYSRAELLMTGWCIADFLLKLFVFTYSNWRVDWLCDVPLGDVAVLVSPAPVSKKTCWLIAYEKEGKSKENQIKCQYNFKSNYQAVSSARQLEGFEGKQQTAW